MKTNPALLSSFFNRGKLVTKPSLKIHASLCIHRVIDAGSLDSMIQLLCCPNPKVTFSRTTGDALIDRARSQEASMFYKHTDADILLFLDDDITYNPHEIVRMCQEANDRKTIVCGAYVNKKEERTWITSKPLNDEPIVFQEGGQLQEVRWGATGCMAIHRNVLTDMIHELKLPLCHPTDLKFWPFFLPMLWQHPNGDHLYLSEDWAFCERARTLGYKIYLDTSVSLGHAGRYNYTLEDLNRPPKGERGVIQYIDHSNTDTSKDLGKHEETVLSA